MSELQAIAGIRLRSIEDGCRQLADILGLDAPVASAVLIAAVQSEEYARNLLVCRRTPAFLDTLLANPTVAPTTAAVPVKGTRELMKQASTALASWSAVGFSVVDSEVFERRLGACVACPNLRPSDSAPSALQKLMKTRASCALCGCDVEKKARMSSERCPGEDPQLAGHNRWGQPLHPA
ncbi:hypothetical protein ACSC9U_10600 [Pseudomonas solani]|uniref:hypothetical protein n=1 Tax=Pseudomonas TaxID=286 RepID=UPI00230615D0|nr:MULTISPECIES: hypothetical protein [unclassified Pseudomonas]MDU9412665.1 hypothetical protein [Pseudomonas sp. zfem005]WCD83435.1 hypothetical protein PI990_15820 [Pseudomonas sp. TUM22785]